MRTQETPHVKRHGGFLCGCLTGYPLSMTSTQRERATWAAEGLCASQPEDLFLPVENPNTDDYMQQSAVLKPRCLSCPVLQECATYSIVHEEFGFWGGMTEIERESIRSQGQFQSHLTTIVRAEQLEPHHLAKTEQLQMARLTQQIPEPPTMTAEEIQSVLSIPLDLDIEW